MIVYYLHCNMVCLNLFCIFRTSCHAGAIQMVDTSAMEDLYVVFLSAICSRDCIRFDKIPHGETSVDGYLSKKYKYDDGQEVDVSIEIQ